jgi:solute carrier family 32 (vesicular inhibitory amino acid transporter)
MVCQNPNTISNFSQSWQRATHFREFDLQHEPALPLAETREPKEDCRGFEPEKSTLCQLSLALSPSSYGTITHGDRHSTPASTQLSNIMAKIQYGELNDLGRSTVPMTIFNWTNMLVGVGTLSLALGFHRCGWIIGLILLTLPVLVTTYTANLLVKCLKADRATFTYGDIACLAYGSLGRHFIEMIFASELVGANAALFILFADSFGALAPVLPLRTYKVIIAIGMVPLNFAQFKALSVTSVVGIFCFIGILTIMMTTGLTKEDAPGSLLGLAKTCAVPCNWKAVPASIGIFMAPWGAHSIVPAIYKDMRHPQKYNKALKCTYSICFVIALSMAVLGYLMFGDGVLPEVTSSILSISEYPPTFSAITLMLVTTIPLTKISLNNRPVIDTINRKLGIHYQQTDLKTSKSGENKRRNQLMRLGVGTLCNLLELALALAIPNFGDVVALLGSALCIAISVILPACFYLRICQDKHMIVTTFDRAACWALIVVGTICATSGTLSMILTDKR